MEDAMATEIWNSVDDYFSRALVKPDPALDAALKASAKAGLRAINVAPNQGKFLHLLAKIRGAHRILEIGTLGGYSAIWLARALPADGSMVSLEANPDYADVARGNIAAAGLSDKVSVITGLAAQSLEELIRSKTPPFDFVFIDADKSNCADRAQSSSRTTWFAAAGSETPRIKSRTFSESARSSTCSPRHRTLTAPLYRLSVRKAGTGFRLRSFRPRKRERAANDRPAPASPRRANDRRCRIGLMPTRSGSACIWTNLKQTKADPRRRESSACTKAAAAD
jgi:predicted O-methyltransferase YrrM